ncbi:MAG: hypothetical protein ACI96P_001917 [Candidatus Azotimanducaceae bacterium]|jgi:hypothetical protein
MGPQPVARTRFYCCNGLEQMMRQPIVSHRYVVTCHISILLWVAGLYKFSSNTLFGVPICQYLADVLRAIVTANGQALMRRASTKTKTLPTVISRRGPVSQQMPISSF